MPYYHIRITRKSSPSKTEVELDLSLDELMEHFVNQYQRGLSIIIAGKIVDFDDIDRIQINVSEEDSSVLNRNLLQRQKRRNILVPLDLRGMLPPRVLAELGKDVTSEYISGRLKADLDEAVRVSQGNKPPAGTREIFVVHGRNTAARNALFEFLRAVDLHPLEWSEAVSGTGKASPYIGEILDIAFSHAHAVVVLMTPDDEARLKEHFWSANEPPHETELTGQARPNVLFEAGMAMGRDQDRTVLVEFGTLRPFSDIGGRHVIRLNNTSQSRQEFAQRLRDAGCPVNLDGTDWHTAGDFEAALALMDEEPPKSTTDAVTQAPIVVLPEFSEDERRILKEATLADDGEIIRLRHGSLLRITTNNEHYCNTDNPRKAAQWEQHLRNLLSHHLIEDTTGDEKIFRVTSKGFEFADGLG